MILQGLGRPSEGFGPAEDACEARQRGHPTMQIQLGPPHMRMPAQVLVLQQGGAGRLQLESSRLLFGVHFLYVTESARACSCFSS